MILMEAFEPIMDCLRQNRGERGQCTIFLRLRSHNEIALSNSR
jgi:hypothetical protein